MDLNVLATGFGSEHDVLRLRAQPAFRKATRKMMMACASIDAALASVARSVAGSNTPSNTFGPGEVGLVLVSGFGELEATAEFLKTWNESKLARPLLFQNSLHSSSTGFAAIQFKLLGPVLTISHRFFGGEQALDLADSLIADGQCRICLVTSVETTLPEFVGGDAGGNQDDVQDHAEGATTLLLSNAQTAREISKTPIAQIRDVICIGETREADCSGPVELAFQTLYASEAVQCIGKLLSATNVGAGEIPRGETIIPKPGFGRSVIRWA